MKFQDVNIQGTLNITGSFQIPYGYGTDSYPQNPLSGSLFLDTSNDLVYVANDDGWEVVGAQRAPLPSIDVEYLVIAGGGGGGGRHAGAGGAGGYLSSSLSAIESGSTITVTVGAGGAGAADGGTSGAKHGNAGNDSTLVSAGGTSFTTVTTVGGGRGGGDPETPSYDGSGGDGGSGGGATYVGSAGSGTVGQGNDGGTGQGSPNYGGGGGGGASTVGANASGTQSGAGGTGLASSITGTSVTRAGGGGAGGWSGVTAGAGGTGGGGAGIGNASNTNATAGTANTGGGGGGGGGDSSAGGTGGSGVVILAYPTGSGNGAGGITGTTSEGKKYHQFNSSGTFKTGITSDFAIHTSNLVMHVDAGNFDSRGTSTTGYDLTSYGNDINLSGQSGGSLTDNPWWNCDGTGGLADFDRNGASMSTDVSHTGYGNFTGQMTVGWCIDFWIKTTATGGWASGGKTIIGRNSGDIYANITIYNNKANWNHYDGSWQNESSTTSINDGSWHHCVFNNHSDETIDIWVDGVKENDGAASGLNQSSRRFKMDSLGRGYNGENTAMDIGQIRVYDASLTDAQVLQNYEATKTNFI